MEQVISVHTSRDCASHPSFKQAFSWFLKKLVWNVNALVDHYVSLLFSLKFILFLLHMNFKGLNVLVIGFVIQYYISITSYGWFFLLQENILFSAMCSQCLKAFGHCFWTATQLWKMWFVLFENYLCMYSSNIHIGCKWEVKLSGLYVFLNLRIIVFLLFFMIKPAVMQTRAVTCMSVININLFLELLYFPFLSGLGTVI